MFYIIHETSPDDVFSRRLGPRCGFFCFFFSCFFITNYYTLDPLLMIRPTPNSLANMSLGYIIHETGPDDAGVFFFVFFYY
jgi:hypothetical protein